MERKYRRPDHPASLIMDIQKGGFEWEGSAAQPLVTDTGSYFWGLSWSNPESSAKTETISWFGASLTFEATHQEADSATGGFWGFFGNRVRSLVAPEIELCGHDLYAEVPHTEYGVDSVYDQFGYQGDSAHDYDGYSLGVDGGISFGPAE